MVMSHGRGAFSGRDLPARVTNISTILARQHVMIWGEFKWFLLAAVAVFQAFRRFWEFLVVQHCWNRGPLEAPA